MTTRQTTLGRLLQERREALGYSRTRTSKITGVPAGTIESWEMGRVAKPPIHDVFRLARFLRIPASSIAVAVLDGSVGDDAARGAGVELGAGEVPLLEEAMRRFGWTVEQAAAALEATPQQVEAWRLGSTTMDFASFMLLASIVGLRLAADARGREARMPELGELLATTRVSLPAV